MDAFAERSATVEYIRFLADGFKQRGDVMSREVAAMLDGLALDIATGIQHQKKK